MEWLEVTIANDGFWWFWGQPTIDNNGFRWLATIGSTMK